MKQSQHEGSPASSSEPRKEPRSLGEMADNLTDCIASIEQEKKAKGLSRKELATLNRRLRTAKSLRRWVTSRRGYPDVR